jgi:hypothetical protein
MAYNVLVVGDVAIKQAQFIGLKTIFTDTKTTIN